MAENLSSAIPVPICIGSEVCFLGTLGRMTGLACQAAKLPLKCPLHAVLFVEVVE